jgi:hypothetical protein
MKMSSFAAMSYTAHGSEVEEQTIHFALWILGGVYSLWPLSLLTFTMLFLLAVQVGSELLKVDLCELQAVIAL